MLILGEYCDRVLGAICMINILNGYIARSATSFYASEYLRL
ncbi:hypothetical protein HMPREF0454_04156 [Hafnia alvei ATCC 51873]|uniref:Uncharacterized protein n=1 Tax=Hafnia alvei ATCC 51873 TaxID=1002364 RepID=G9YC30_HAFAL|nr:hypothetical protein HMPREF0454_04156 [Hafnia alvei ATCC 51873]